MKRPRHVHVLFVHGVGRHPRLSALLRAYQGFRSDLLSTEAPSAREDLIPEWKLEEFSDDPAAPHIKLSPTKLRGQQPKAVHLYEVNYSSLSGVIRENQPLDITRLFVGLDLAVNVVRQRMPEPQPAPPGPLAASANPTGDRFNPDHAALAHYVQKLTGVLVACSVPILSLPTKLLHNYTETFVTDFTRFFEDVATLALDNSAQELIQGHVDQTIKNVLKIGKFDRQHDEFVIVAHSLGSIVAHTYLLNHWSKTGNAHVVPSRLLTYGSPIGLICWMWLFLDFPGFRFDPKRPTGRNYFCWDPAPGVPKDISKRRKPVQWINVVNHLDPIAAAFPQEYVDLTHPPGKPLPGLQGGKVEHRYVKTGGVFSAGFAHTAYATKSKEFQDILGRMAYLHDGNPLAPAEPSTESIGNHWKRTMRDLMRLRAATWFAGLVAIGVYLTWITNLFNEPGVMILLPLYAWPPATIATLALFQRMTYGKSTKRTGKEKVLNLSWFDLASLPYRLRYFIGLGHRSDKAKLLRPGWLSEFLTSLVAIIPTLAIMAVPILLAREWTGEGRGLGELVTNNPLTVVSLVGIFFLYLVLFAISEFVTQWRALVVELTRDRFPERDPAVGINSWPVFAFLVWSVIALMVWGVARLTLCWGDYGWLGDILCRAHWGTFALLVGAAVAFWSLLRALAETTLLTEKDISEQQHFRRTRAAWQGYRSLKGSDFTQATLSPLLMILLLILLVWLLVFSPVRF